MAKYPIPVHIAKSEKGADKIITSKKRVEELGANAFIVSKASMAKLDAPPPESPAIDYYGLATLAAGAVRKMPGVAVPVAAVGSILREWRNADHE